MSILYFIIGLLYLVIGFAVALLFYYVLRRGFLGGVWAALAVGVIGSVAGGIVDHYFSDVFSYLANLFNAMNIFPPIVTSFFFVWIFSRLSRPERDDE